jgi:hypothetical protein
MALLHSEKRGEVFEQGSEASSIVLLFTASQIFAQRAVEVVEQLHVIRHSSLIKESTFVDCKHIEAASHLPAAEYSLQVLFGKDLVGSNRLNIDRDDRLQRRVRLKRLPVLQVRTYMRS